MVGSCLLSFLKADRVTAVSRRPVEIPGATTLVHDIARPFEIPESVTEIYHCAADVRFHVSLEESRATNVEGTRNVLNAARRLKNLEKLVHVSSVYAAGAQTGSLRAERWPRPAAGFVNPYQQTKWESEDLVFDAFQELPIAIVRLSSIFGDSRTGQVDQYNHTHQLLRFLPRNFIPLVPCSEGASLDLIATDWLATNLRQEFNPGEIYHLCAGPGKSLGPQDLVRIASEVMTVSPARLPRFAPMGEYQQYVDGVLASADRLARESVRALHLMLPHFGLRQDFEPSPGLAPPPEPREFVRRVVEHCVRANWGRPA